MSRYLSFGLLIVVILFLCIVFYKVMASFLLPLFLAAVLVVVFRPVHQWVESKCGNRHSLACGLTTAIICLSVLVPVGVVGTIAFGEARHLLKDLATGGLEQNLKRVRKSLNLEMPAVEQFRALDLTVHQLDLRNLDEYEVTHEQLDLIDQAANSMATSLKIPQSTETGDLDDHAELSRAQILAWNEFRDSLKSAREQNAEILDLDQAIDGLGAVNKNPAPTNGDGNDAGNKQAGSNRPADDVKSQNDSKAPVKGALDESQKPQSSTSSTEPNGDRRDQLAEEKTEKLAKYIPVVKNVSERYDHFKSLVLGGPIGTYLKEMANPTEAEFAEYNSSLIDWIKTNFLSLGGKATQFAFSLLFNGAIMIIAIYFFLYDGARMIVSLKFLSPLDDRHEQELIDEFDKVSRAVVVATLAAALSQGLLAGVGYYFAGVEAVFLLTLLTTVLALVPFVGAAAIWVPTCVYLYLIDDRLVPAVMLAIWGSAVVSTVDNLVKPMILHGQSNIHPLLALLSVLGGVSALGPIGILVGPMVVAFLQTLLRILQRELTELDSDRADEAGEEINVDEASNESENSTYIDEKGTVDNLEPKSKSKKSDPKELSEDETVDLDGEDKSSPS